MNFKDKIVLVTGASRGIGFAIATQFAKSGATVVGTATSELGCEKMASAFFEQQLSIHPLVLDVSSLDSIDAAFKQCQSEVGAPNILINNAGITRDTLLMRLKDEDWMAVINTNLTSAYRLSKLAIKSMMKAKWGRIINISSVVGAAGNPGQSNYCASKAGLEGFSRSLASELASRNITVNCVAPGFIQTDMTDGLPDEQKHSLLTSIPMSRLGQPSDIAAATAFLASDGASYITGQTLHVNGGMYMA